MIKQMIFNTCLLAHTKDKTETLVTIGDMTCVREKAETDFYNYVLYSQIDPISIFSELA